MKFNVVAAALLRSLALAGLLFFSSGAALALDGIDLSVPAEEVGEGECSRLIQIKYPFLSCANGEIGLADGDATWENSRQIPLQSSWIEGDGYWGPSYNEDGAYYHDEKKAER
jgi:hypothetical protein